MPSLLAPLLTFIGMYIADIDCLCYMAPVGNTTLRARVVRQGPYHLRVHTLYMRMYIYIYMYMYLYIHLKKGHHRGIGRQYKP